MHVFVNNITTVKIENGNGERCQRGNNPTKEKKQSKATNGSST